MCEKMCELNKQFYFAYWFYEDIFVGNGFINFVSRQFKAPKHNRRT